MRKNYILPSNADIKVDELGLSEKTTLMLKKAGINTISELLSISEQDLAIKYNIIGKNFDEISYKLISMGYILNGEYINSSYLFSQFYNAIKNRGEHLLEEVGLSDELSSYLHKIKIYSVELLMHFKPAISSKIILSPKDKDVLGKLYYVDEALEDELKKVLIQNLIILNDNERAIERIIEKERLLSEYNELVNKKNELLEKERILDENISVVKKTLNIQ